MVALPVPLIVRVRFVPLSERAKPPVPKVVGAHCCSPTKCGWHRVGHDAIDREGIRPGDRAFPAMETARRLMLLAIVRAAPEAVSVGVLAFVPPRPNVAEPSAVSLPRFRSVDDFLEPVRPKSQRRSS